MAILKVGWISKVWAIDEGQVIRPNAVILAGANVGHARGRGFVDRLSWRWPSWDEFVPTKSRVLVPVDLHVLEDLGRAGERHR